MHVLLSLEVGGMENGVVNTLGLINRARFEPSICCLERLGPLARRVKETKIFNMKKNSGFSLRLLFKLITLLNNEKIDIVHTHCWATLVYGFMAAKIARVPFVVHGEHGTFNLDPPRRLFAYKLFISHVNSLLTVSQSLTDEIRKLSKKDLNINTIVNGVDTDLFYPQDSKALKKKLGLKTDDMVIGSVGRLESVKNYKLLIRCVAQIDNPLVKGVLIGDGSLRTELKNLVKNLGLTDRFIFLGERHNIRELIGLFDIFVLCSFSEGLSNTILEAMSSGIPIVVSEVGGNLELVEDNKNGISFESNNLSALKKAITDLLSDPVRLNAMGRNGRHTVLTRHSIKGMVEKYEKGYLSLFS